MLCSVTFEPDHKTIRVKRGTTLLAASRAARVSVRTRCGGHASCLMCKVHIEDQSGISPMESKEEMKLGDLVLQGTRLACQAKVLNETIVQIPEDPLKAAIRAQLAKQNEDELW